MALPCVVWCGGAVRCGAVRCGAVLSTKKKRTDFSALLEHHDANLFALLVGQLLKPDGRRETGGTSADDEHVDVVRLTRLLTRIVVLCTHDTHDTHDTSVSHAMLAAHGKKMGGGAYGGGKAKCGRTGARR
jgi:hypothetical protein